MQDNIFTDWLHRRGITDNVMHDFNIHFSENIIIPVNDHNGTFSFNKYRRHPLKEDGPKYFYDKGGKVTLYGYDVAKDYDTILITEGELDTLVAWSNNIPAVSSTGGAQSFQAEWSGLFTDKKVYVCLDNDDAGGNGMARILDLIPQAAIVFLPDRPGVKDITDYVSSGGNLHDLLKSAVRFTSLEQIMEHRNARIALWQSTHFHDAYIRNHTPAQYDKKTVRKNNLPDDRIARAKLFPIDHILTFSRYGKCKCLWHSEKTESMHYYHETNKVHCFGCGKSADAIDVWMQVNQCSFLQAVDRMQ